jgi:outer membrane murein-binding lipoprotein Lpp
MRPTTHSLLFVGLSALVLLAGCRTYGGRGTEAQTYEEMGAAVAELESDLESAQSDLQQLRAAAEQDSSLLSLVERYQDLVQIHESMISAQRERVDTLSADASYRTLHRTYGAMITDQTLLRTQYTRTVRQVYAAVRDTTAPGPPVRSTSTYSITPVDYPDPRRRAEGTMAAALAPVMGTPGLQPAEE